VRFLGFAHNQHPTFYGSQKEYATQKVANVKGPRKRKGKGQEKKNSERGITPNWNLHIFVPNPREIFLFGKN